MGMPATAKAMTLKTSNAAICPPVPIPDFRIAAIAAILKAGTSTGAEIAALLVFNIIAFAVAGIPLISFFLAPDATRARVDQLYAWVSNNQRVVITALTTIVGVYLILIGISKL